MQPRIIWRPNHVSISPIELLSSPPLLKRSLRLAGKIGRYFVLIFVIVDFLESFDPYSHRRFQCIFYQLVFKSILWYTWICNTCKRTHLSLNDHEVFKGSLTNGNNKTRDVKLKLEVLIVSIRVSVVNLKIASVSNYFTYNSTNISRVLLKDNVMIIQRIEHSKRYEHSKWYEHRKLYEHSKEQVIWTEHLIWTNFILYHISIQKQMLINYALSCLLFSKGVSCLITWR